jgi:hypothetical protein
MTPFPSHRLRTPARLRPPRCRRPRSRRSGSWRGDGGPWACWYVTRKRVTTESGSRTAPVASWMLRTKVGTDIGTEIRPELRLKPISRSTQSHGFRLALDATLADNYTFCQPVSDGRASFKRSDDTVQRNAIWGWYRNHPVSGGILSAYVQTELVRFFDEKFA